MNTNGALVAPLPMVFLAQTNATYVENLGNDRMGRVWRGNAGVCTASIDLGVSTAVDCFAILASDLPAGATWQIDGSTSSDFSANIYTKGGIAAWASADAGRRVHRQGLFYLPTAISRRYWRLTVQSPVAFTIGRFVIGKALEIGDTQDIGWSFKIIDTGEAKVSTTGLDDPTIRGKVLEYSWTWSWMRKVEARGPMLDIQAYAGVTRDILLVLEPLASDLHNVIAFGKLQESAANTNVVSGPDDLDNAYDASFRLRSKLILAL